jgi:predicted dehydrogenase
MEDKKVQILKVIRFIKIYGLSRTFTKVSGRLRLKNRLSYSRGVKKNVVLIGCGHFTFSTICHFVKKNYGNSFLACFDIDEESAKSLAEFHNVDHVIANQTELFELPETEIVYVASNHASHTSYAVKALEKNLIVHVEKPISTSRKQFIELITAVQKYKGRISAGYNRPFAAATRQLKQVFQKESKEKKAEAFTLTFHISGHVLPLDHWYRNPEEGTRVCGNLGHWLDLSIHILSWRNIPNNFDLLFQASRSDQADDNFSLILTTDQGDLITFVFTARGEPFEGVTEGIDFHYGDIIARINDFRKMRICIQEKVISKSYWPKDAGHEKSVLQALPLKKKESRDWHEVELSTLLMLRITEMIEKKESSSSINLHEDWQKIQEEISSHNKTSSR